MKKLNLTIDEIHEIRAEHYLKTKDMTFDEYRKDMEAEIEPLMHILKNRCNDVRR